MLLIERVKHSSSRSFDGIEYASTGCLSVSNTEHTPDLHLRVADQSRAKQTLAQLSIDFFLCQGLFEKPLLQALSRRHRINQYYTLRRLRPDSPSLSLYHRQDTYRRLHIPHKMAQSAAPNNPFIKQLVHNGILLLHLSYSLYIL